MNWTYIWNRLRAVPAGVWAALGAGTTLLVLYLRGRRLEAELAQTQLKLHAADAAAKGARSEARAKLHMERADEHNARVVELEKIGAVIEKMGQDEQRRIAALPPSQITAEYLRLAGEEKKKL
jgi:hypothetical protein